MVEKNIQDVLYICIRTVAYHSSIKYSYRSISLSGRFKKK